MWSGLKNYTDIALLIVRVWLGVVVIWLFGWPKLKIGLRAWQQYAVNELDVAYLAGMWGFIATLSETIGCALIVLGLFFRPAVLLILLMCAWACGVDFFNGNISASNTERLMLTLIFGLLLFAGPGRFSLDKG